MDKARGYEADIGISRLRQKISDTAPAIEKWRAGKMTHYAMSQTMHNVREIVTELHAERARQAKAELVNNEYLLNNPGRFESRPRDALERLRHFAGKVDATLGEYHALQLEVAAADMNDKRHQINLSPRHLLREDLPRMLLGALRNNDMNASAMMLELTESGLVGGLELVRERIQQLAISGFQIAVDDFGTGHSTLGMLIELPIDKLKIDQSFVRGRIPHDPEAVKVLDAMLALARELQLHVVVEGVETAEQARFIRARNPQALLQGYYFDRPTSAYPWDGLLLDGCLPQYEI